MIALLLVQLIYCIIIFKFMLSFVLIIYVFNLEEDDPKGSIKLKKKIIKQRYIKDQIIKIIIYFNHINLEHFYSKFNSLKLI